MTRHSTKKDRHQTSTAPERVEVVSDKDLEAISGASRLPSSIHPVNVICGMVNTTYDAAKALLRR